MLVVEPGTHGSTYGGNPLGCAVSLRALELIEEEDMTGRAEKLGQIFREGVTSFNSSIVQKVRGKGLLNAVVIDESAANGRSAWDLCILLKEKGLLVSLISDSCRLVLFHTGDRLLCTSSPPLLQVPLQYLLYPPTRLPYRPGQRSKWMLTRNRRNRHMGTSSDSLRRWSSVKWNCARP